MRPLEKKTEIENFWGYPEFAKMVQLGSPIINWAGPGVNPRGAQSYIDVPMGWIVCKVPVFADGKRIPRTCIKHGRHMLRYEGKYKTFWNIGDGDPYGENYYESYCRAVGVPTIDDMLKTLRTTEGKNYFKSAERAAMGRSSRSGRDHSIAPGWMKKQYMKQRGRCAISGLPMMRDRYKRSPFMPTIDRIDNDLGYEADNCRLVCHAVNIGRGIFSDEDYRFVCAAVAGAIT